MRLMTTFVVGALIVVAGCASTPPADGQRAASPPQIEEFVARYENGGLCKARQEHEVIAAPQTDVSSVTIELCSPVFPQELMARGYEADCLVRFQVAATGLALAPAGACDLLAGHSDKDWDAFALAAFTRLAEMSAAQSRYDGERIYAPSPTYLRRYSYRLR